MSALLVPNTLLYPQARNTWRSARVDGRRIVQLACPGCGKTARLADHLIATDGTVAPSVVCPHPPCTFHEVIQLDGWTP